MQSAAGPDTGTASPFDIWGSGSPSASFAPSPAVAIAAIDHRARVNVEAHHHGNTLTVARSIALHHPKRGRTSCHTITSDERWIEIVHRTPLVPEPIHSSAALLQRGDDSLGRALGNVEHFVCRGRRERAEDRLSHRIILPHIDPVQRERVYMHVETERRVEALDERHRPGKRTIDACKPEEALRSPSQRTQELLHTCIHQDAPVAKAGD
ncbi:hypothetical protein [Polyangium jinanense]|uniref:hypothetical protein n=1 Tax=Polyangium jinanense TaxID=2829994 RepID=UPI0023412BCD|nr:hypothetical protein [Polyangium jinanense]